MVYSGGVDALTAYLSHRDENPDLVTIQTTFDFLLMVQFMPGRSSTSAS